MRKWYEPPGLPGKASERFILEVGLIKALFNKGKRTRIEAAPGSWDQEFEIETLDLEFDRSNPYQPYWRVVFRMHELNRYGEVSSRSRFEIRIVYPTDYPADEPHVYVDSPSTLGSPHKFPGGRLCLHNHWSKRSGWDPARSTAATFGLWTIQWLRTWLYWKKTDRWPDVTNSRR